MDPRRRESILKTLESIRRENDAFLIVGISEEQFLGITYLTPVGDKGD